MKKPQWLSRTCNEKEKSGFHKIQINCYQLYLYQILLQLKKKLIYRLILSFFYFLHQLFSAL